MCIYVMIIFPPPTRYNSQLDDDLEVVVSFKYKVFKMEENNATV